MIALHTVILSLRDLSSSNSAEINELGTRLRTYRQNGLWSARLRQHQQSGCRSDNHLVAGLVLANLFAGCRQTAMHLF